MQVWSTHTCRDTPSEHKAMVCTWCLQRIYSMDVQWFVLAAYQVYTARMFNDLYLVPTRCSMDFQWFALVTDQVQHVCSMICTWCLPGTAWMFSYLYLVPTRYSTDVQSFVLGAYQVQYGCSVICTWCLPGTAWTFNYLCLVPTRYSMDIQWLIGTAWTFTSMINGQHSHWIEEIQAWVGTSSHTQSILQQRAFVVSLWRRCSFQPQMHQVTAIQPSYLSCLLSDLSSEFLLDCFRLSSGASSFSSSLSSSVVILPSLSDLEGSGWTSAMVCVKDGECRPGGKLPLATRDPLTPSGMWPLAVFSPAAAGLCINLGSAET